MIIGVDAGVLGVTDDRLKVGVYHFALNLLKNLANIDKKNKYLLYSFDPIPSKILEKLDTNWSNLVLRPKIGWLSLRLSVEFLVHKPDIFLGLSQALPLYHPAKSIVFVYDLAFELYPQFYPDSYKRLARQTRFVGRNSDKIVAVSKATKNDLVRLYKIDSSKIEVIYPGVSVPPPRGSPFGHPRGVFDASATPEVPKPFFLFVGSYKPGKNIPNIIKAFRLFLKEIKRPYRLVLAGSNYWGDVGDRGIKKLGYVEDADLARLYRDAQAFISPSYYEGFGMPILEAMAAGIPVITSGCGSIPEVTDDAALVVDPDDINEIKNAMIKVATDRKLRSQMIKKGLAQAQKFSWQKSARELLRLINSF